LKKADINHQETTMSYFNWTQQSSVDGRNKNPRRLTRGQRHCFSEERDYLTALIAAGLLTAAFPDPARDEHRRPKPVRTSCLYG
jgi:hypothetical protein